MNKKQIQPCKKTRGGGAGQRRGDHIRCLYVEYAILQIPTRSSSPTQQHRLNTTPPPHTHTNTGMFSHMGTHSISTALDKRHDARLQAPCWAAAILHAFTGRTDVAVRTFCTFADFLSGIFPSLRRSASTRHRMLAAVWGRPRRHPAVQDQTSSYGCNSHVRKAEYNINMQLMARKLDTRTQKCGQASHLRLNRLSLAYVCKS